MQQVFRRHLLACNRLTDDASADVACDEFIRVVLEADISERPAASGVLDILLAGSVRLSLAERFVDRFEAGVWNGKHQ